MELNYKETVLIAVALNARISALKTKRNEYAEILKNPNASGLLREMMHSTETRIAEYQKLADRITAELDT